MTTLLRRPPVRAASYIGVFGAAIFVIALIIWQGVTAHGTPDSMQPDTSSTVAFMDIGILVFREGLECILVLAAITASMTGSDHVHRRPVAMGAGMAFVATLVTWFIAIKIVGQLTESVPALDLQAATGLVAVIVLLVIMNWFFHKIYWGGWIRAHNRRRKALFASSNGESSRQTPFLGFDCAWIYFPLSRRLRSCSFSSKLQSATGQQRRAKRRVARPSPLGDGSCTYVRSAAASPISKDADYHRHSAGSRLRGNGR
jgi:iron permease FTR1 family protein